MAYAVNFYLAVFFAFREKIDYFRSKASQEQAVSEELRKHLQRAESEFLEERRLVVEEKQKMQSEIQALNDQISELEDTNNRLNRKFRRSATNTEDNVVRLMH